MNIKVITLLVITLTAFAANSILCRLALKSNLISAEEFTIIRLLSGAVILFPIIFKNKSFTFIKSKKTWGSSLALFSYAFLFSVSYVNIDAGMGALILFAAVQIFMIIYSIISGSKLSKLEWLGFILAFGGLTYLLLPGKSAPPFYESLIMLFSGLSWGAYTILGKKSKNPIQNSAENFFLTIPFLVAVIFILRISFSFKEEGMILAVTSGAITSGLGYVLWYIILPQIKTSVAAIVQLSVPMIAAFGGVLFVGEEISLRQIISTILVIFGILLTIKAKS